MTKRSFQEKEFLRNFGFRVQQLRRRAGLTQEALAERLDINQDMISRLENGVVGIVFSRLLMLAKALDVEPRDLLNFEGVAFKSKKPLKELSDILFLLEGQPRRKLQGIRRLIKEELRPKRRSPTI